MTTARRLFSSPRLLAVVVAVLAIGAGDRLISLSIQPDLPRYSFAVTIEGRALSGFREVGGLDVELEVIEYRDGSGGPARYVPGARKYPNIVLKRGFTGDTQLHDWFTEFDNSRTERVNGSIVMYDQGREEIARWNFHNAWPSKLSGPALNASPNEVPIESIELVHEGLTRVIPAPR
jgi:phage tail-like protein